ncbi:hypothetical protein ALC57_07039 [Trachymyrmex cornetzi]|uniref:Uncharacterized protein n=1 Tax=Trachymyrmex cornetzi TaxID=471704 RepID=A0A195E5S7_9HYME|nr:hypothetical protein ALC57_07039 [Trachymyrmex cornetzi]
MRIVFRVVHERQTGRKPEMLPHIRTGRHPEGREVTIEEIRRTNECLQHGGGCWRDSRESIQGVRRTEGRKEGKKVLHRDAAGGCAESDMDGPRDEGGEGRSIGRESDGRRVCKRRAARGGCTAPTFRGEAGDPIAMHHPVLYQQLPAIAAPTRPPRNFSSLLPSFSLSLSLSLSLAVSFSLFLSLPSPHFVASAATRSFSFRFPSSRFSPFGRAFSPLSSRRCLSFISSVSTAMSLPTIRALVFPRHSSTAVVTGPSCHFATLPNAEISFYAHRVTRSSTSFAVRLVILMRIRAEFIGGCNAMERYDATPVERRRKKPKRMERTERASAARIDSVKNGNRISIIS